MLSSIKVYQTVQSKQEQFETEIYNCNISFLVKYMSGDA